MKTYIPHYRTVKKDRFESGLARFSSVEIHMERDFHYNFEQGYNFSSVIQNPQCQSNTVPREYVLTDSF